MRIHDVVMGPLILLTGLGLCLWASFLPHPGNVAFGPGLFPTLTGSGLAISGSIIGLSGWLKRRGQPLFHKPEWMSHRNIALNFWLIPLLIVGYLLCVDTLGFLLTATIVLFSMMVANAVAWSRALPTAIVTAASINVLFASLLHVPLPWGPLTNVSGWLIW
ncbi:tripartite tricarboxylate transporter TctB family protein [Modicisalibacter radicis]|uniref:tripartite tricarboxylate transporter TctB family protein n=1 Tax=Halomonas sp. EAR18 TaxID=2518972 RepID=UPI00109C8EA7|nr:tripartite tricarboxylate transporter TctB family protein [Halomonas sp. EAR18]